MLLDLFVRILHKGHCLMLLAFPCVWVWLINEFHLILSSMFCLFNKNKLNHISRFSTKIDHSEFLYGRIYGIAIKAVSKRVLGWRNLEGVTSWTQAFDCPIYESMIYHLLKSVPSRLVIQKSEHVDCEKELSVYYLFCRIDIKYNKKDKGNIYWECMTV